MKNVEQIKELIKEFNEKFDLQRQSFQGKQFVYFWKLQCDEEDENNKENKEKVIRHLKKEEQENSIYYYLFFSDLDKTSLTILDLKTMRYKEI